MQITPGLLAAIVMSGELNFKSNEDLNQESNSIHYSIGLRGSVMLGRGMSGMVGNGINDNAIGGMVC